MHISYKAALQLNTTRKGQSRAFDSTKSSLVVEQTLRSATHTGRGDMSDETRNAPSIAVAGVSSVQPAKKEPEAEEADDALDEADEANGPEDRPYICGMCACVSSPAPVGGPMLGDMASTPTPTSDMKESRLPLLVRRGCWSGELLALGEPMAKER